MFFVPAPTFGCFMKVMPPSATKMAVMPAVFKNLRRVYVIVFTSKLKFFYIIIIKVEVSYKSNDIDL